MLVFCFGEIFRFDLQRRNKLPEHNHSEEDLWTFTDIATKCSASHLEPNASQFLMVRTLTNLYATPHRFCTANQSSVSSCFSSLHSWEFIVNAICFDARDEGSSAGKSKWSQELGEPGCSAAAQLSCVLFSHLTQLLPHPHPCRRHGQGALHVLL